MFEAACPACGAPINFRSHASVVAVCEYCKSTVAKQGDVLEDLGKKSQVLEDYSPVQIGSSGTFEGLGFTVIGRIQVKYEDGFWNEWHLFFADNTTGWLGEASGQFTITRAKAANNLPAFETLNPGEGLSILDRFFLVSDVRSAQASGLEGELPVSAKGAWQVRAVDLRIGLDFATLDYSDPTPQLYLGKSVKFESLQWQLLRSDDTILAAATRYRGQLSQLECPQCGSPSPFIPGLTANLVCPACGSDIDAAGDKAKLIHSANRQLDTSTLAYPLGSQAKIGNFTYTLIGALKKINKEGERWHEYLLYAPRPGFLWLIQTQESWYLSTVEDTWPEGTLGGETLYWKGQTFDLAWDYIATTQLAVGAFNWCAKEGDKVHVFEYQKGNVTLAIEKNENEVTLSQSTSLSASAVAAYFSPNAKQSKKTALPKQQDTDNGKNIKTIMNASLIFLAAVNLIPFLADSGTTTPAVFIGGTLIWVIGIMLGAGDKDHD